MIDLSEVPTKQLVEELEKREGVESDIVGYNQDIDVHVSGPAIVLVVTD